MKIDIVGFLTRWRDFFFKSPGARGAHIGYTTLVLTAECTLVAAFGGDHSSRNGAYGPYTVCRRLTPTLMEWR